MLSHKRLLEDCPCNPGALGVSIMRFNWANPLAALATLLLLREPSVASPTSAAVKLRMGTIYRMTSGLQSNIPHGFHQNGEVKSHNAIERRSSTPCPIIGCKYLQRYPKSVIVPTVMAAETLKAFWTKIAMDAMEAEIEHIINSFHFSITAGALQVTMSSVGQAIPWDFVQDFALNQIKAVAMGWLDTFDAIYQQDGTGFMVFVSMKIIESLKDLPSRKRPRPGADWR